MNAQPVEQFESCGVNDTQRGLRHIRFGKRRHQPVALFGAECTAWIDGSAERETVHWRQCLIGGSKRVAELGHPNREFTQHAWMLRALAGEEKCDFAVQRT